MSLVMMFVYFFQPDELYFEEGDILYISDTVSQSLDLFAAVLIKSLFPHT